MRRDNVWEKFEIEFPNWFQQKVLQEKPGSDVLHALAMGPSTRVKTWNQIFVNGFNFQTFEYGKNKSTMNYGVCVSSADGVHYYGILDDIIEVEYSGRKRQYKTILFKCSWMDCGRGMNVHEQYKIVEVNHTKKYPKYDPFVLSYQVSQVYYASYPSLKRDRAQWWAVFKTHARSDIDAPVDDKVLQAIAAEEQSTLCPPNDILGYVDDGDESDLSDNELEDEQISDDDESSIGSSESDEDDLPDVILDDSSDDYSSDKCNSDEQMDDNVD